MLQRLRKLFLDWENEQMDGEGLQTGLGPVGGSPAAWPWPGPPPTAGSRLQAFAVESLDVRGQ